MSTSTKQKIRRAFNDATITYDTAADWQKSAGNLLLNYITSFNPENKRILDLGAGTGYVTKHLQRQFPNNQFIVLDIAEKMLKFSQQHLNNSHLVCADAENLAIRSNSVDIIVSNMVLHWCQSLTSTLEEQQRILKKDGLFFFTLLGSDSLSSLKNAWSYVDNDSHVNQFPSAQTIQETCKTAGFSLLRFEQHKIQKNYKNVFELMQHLKDTGAKHVPENSTKGLMGKQKINQLNQRYKNPINYEIFTGILKK